MNGSEKTVKVTLVMQVQPYARGAAEASTATSKLGKDIDAVDAKNKGFAKSAGQSTAALKGMAAAGAAVAGTALVAFLSDAVGAASDLNETVAKTGQIFGQEALPGLEAFAEGAAESLGQSKQQALDAAATFGVFGKSAGLAGEPLADFSRQMVTLTSDMASFSNTTPEEAIEAVGAALRGEAEPIRKYGVLLDDATLRQRALKLGLIATTTEALTPQQKVLAAQAEILAQTSDAQGDFARTSDGLANQQRILAAEFENAKTSLGEVLLPVILKATEALRAGLDIALAVAGAFGQLPGPVKVAAGALIAFHLLRGPLGGMLTSTIAHVKTLGTTLKGAGIAGNAKAAGTALMGAFGGPLGIAIGVGAAALTFWAGEAEKVNAIADELAATLDKTSGGFTAQASSIGLDKLLGDLSDDDINRMRDLGVNFEQLAKQALGSSSDFDAANASLDRLRDFDWLFAKDDSDIIDGLQASLGRLHDAAGRTKTVADVKGPIDAVAGAASGAAPMVDTYKESLNEARKAAEDIAEANQKAAQSILDVADAAVAADKAEADYQQALDDATKAIEENGKTVNKNRTELNLNTEAGRENHNALVTLRDRAYDVAKANLTNGDSVASVKAKMIEAREAFITNATKMGLTKTAAEKLATQYGLTAGKVDDIKTAMDALPASVTAKVNVQTAEALRKLAALRAAITASLSAPGVITAEIASAARNADGGFIRGPGTATSDSIPSWLSDGEYVVKAAAVSKYGKGFFDSVNAMRFSNGGFASRMAPAAMGGFPSAEEVGRALARFMPPQQNIQSGLDAMNAAREVQAKWEWDVTNGN